MKLLNLFCFFFCLALFCLSLSGCFGLYSQIGDSEIGLIVQDVKVPRESHNEVKPEKNSEGCVKSILGLVSWGDSGIEEVKRLKGISKVASVDHYKFQVLGLYGKSCTVIRGE
jgi:hypothetical protein